MKKHLITLIERLKEENQLSLEEYKVLIEGYHPEIAEYAAKEAVKVRQNIYGNKIFVRGLIEISNICKNDCYYCGIRRSNQNCERYRLSKEEILECCKEGYELGFRTFVMQGGEVGRDIHVYRDLIENPCEASIDAEAKYLLEFEKTMLRKYNII